MQRFLVDNVQPYLPAGFCDLHGPTPPLVTVTQRRNEMERRLEAMVLILSVPNPEVGKDIGDDSGFTTASDGKSDDRTSSICNDTQSHLSNC